MRRFFRGSMVFLFTTLALFLPALAFADPAADPAAPAAPPDPPATLADALKIATLPDPGQVVIAVNGDWVNPPKSAWPLGKSPHFPVIAQDYGMQYHTYGTVTALAPNTMTVLNTAPGEPNIYANLPTYDAFTLLVASLSNQQWNDLIGSQGLALSDLNSDWQKQLLLSLISKDGTLIVQPRYRAGVPWNQSDQIDETAQIGQCRMKMSMTVNLDLPIKDGNGSSYGSEWAPPANGATEYEVANRADFGGSSSTAYGSVVKADFPNILKPSQLDYDAPVFQAQIPLAGIKYVADLITRVSQITHVEIYCDKRLNQSLQILADAPSARACDLLRALSLAHTTTFRQVGPAYILTDDIAGVGARKLLWLQYDKLAEAMREGPVNQAAQSNFTQRNIKDIPWADPGLEITPDEANQRPGQTNPANPNAAALYSFQTTFDKLTPSQQAMAQSAEAEWNAQNKDNPYNKPVTTEGNIMVSPALQVQLIVPGLDQPVDMGINGMGNLDASMAFQQPAPDSPAGQMHQPAPATPEQVSQAELAMIANSPQRAVISHARNTAGVDADIAAMKTLGLTQMWLDIFSDGHAYIPGSPLSKLSKAVQPGERDILAEAIAKGHENGIAVYAMMDLFYWGSNPAEGLADLNIFGQTSSQEQALWDQRNSFLPPGQHPQEYFMTGVIVPVFPGVAVAPTNSQVENDLIRVARLAAAHPGLAGIVLRDTDPPGYDLGANYNNSSQSPDLELGFVPSARLAFIRQDQIDPIDLYPSGHWMGIADTNLPYFNDDNGWTDQLTTKGEEDWSQFRRKADLALLRQIALAAFPANPASAANFMVIVKQRRHGPTVSFGPDDISYGNGWYGSWDRLSADPPTYHGYEDVVEPGQFSQRPASETDQAKQESRIVMTPVTYQDFTRYAQFEAMRAQLAARFPKVKMAPYPPMQSIVLDLSGDPIGDDGDGDDPITHLAAFAKAGKLGADSVIGSQAAQPASRK